MSPSEYQAKKTKTEKNQVPTTEVSVQDDGSTKKYVVLMVSLTTVIVIFGAIAIYWLGSRYVEQSNKNKAQDQTIALTRQKKDNLELLKPNYNNITAKGTNGKSDADLILNAVPTDEGYNQLIAMLEKMGQEAGIGVSSISKSSQAGANPTAVGAVTSVAGVNNYQVSLTASGTFDRIQEFIKKTEDSSRVLDFVSMNISGSTQSNSTSANMTFKVYWKGPANINPTDRELQ